jgi:uroporphyrinogen decarboxylase
MDSVWWATEAKWRSQGFLPEGISANDFLDFDMAWFAPDVSLQLPYKVIEEDDEYITYQNQNGSIRRDHKDYTSTPQILSTIIQEPDDWLKVKHKLEPDPGRVDWDVWLPEFERNYNNDRYITFAAANGYDWTQHLIDSERLLMYILTEPDMVVDIYRTQSDLILRMFDMMLERGFKFDGALLFCDLGYRHGPLFSPEIYREQLFPIHKEMYEYFHEHGCQTFLHSCGDVRQLMPMFIEAGIDCLNPCEVKANMDIMELKAQYGDEMAFFGALDVRLLEQSNPSTIEEKIRKFVPVANENGGYIFGSDHSVTTEVDFQVFKKACDLARSLTKT